MSYTNNIMILIADKDETKRLYMAGILESRGYQVIQAIDGGTAIKVVEEHPVDLVILGHDMKPRSGWECARHILTHGYKIGMIMVTETPAADLLEQAQKHQIRQVLSWPVDDNLLKETVRRVLKLYGKNPDALGGGGEKSWSAEEAMRRVLHLAEQNARAQMGGAFAALVVDEHGHILGEGVNSVHLRHDPIAHAEVLAIRRATEKKRSLELTGCILYCSSEPTMLGQALIIGTGIQKVVYGLTHEETGRYAAVEKGLRDETAKPRDQREVPYEQYMHDEALAMFRKVQK